MENGHKNNANSTISVILPTYNRAHILKRSVESVLAQTYKNFELIIVDDGSTDNTKELVNSFSDPRLRYIKHEKNLGLAASRNTGIKEARGKLIANQDSDDIWFPQKLEKEIAAFRDADADVGIVYSRLKKEFSKDKIELIPSDKQKPKQGNLHKALLEKNFITMQSALARKKCFEEEMFDKSLPALQDWDLWIRISKKWKFKYIPEVLCHAFVSEDSITKKRGMRAKARKMIFEKHRAEFEKYPKIFSRHAYMIGCAELKWGRKTKAKKYIFEAWEKRPFNIKYLIKFLIPR